MDLLVDLDPVDNQNIDVSLRTNCLELEAATHNFNQTKSRTHL